MQLLAIVLYHADGRTRRLDFEPGALNIVTGESQTGKSALLTIVEYCLGRSTMLVPVGPIADTVVWYAALWQLDDGRAFVARPAPAAGRASTSVAMLEFGTNLDAPPLEALNANIESRALREQLGRRIGIEENVTEPEAGSLRQPLEANIGHAALLCLQSQNEVASANSLFHRQGEPGIDQALRDTIPYFLGAVARDEALKRAQLRDAMRTVTRLTAELARAETTAATIDVELNALLTEARAVGLVGEVEFSGRTELVRVLQGARVAQPQVPPLADTEAQDRRLALQAERDRLRGELRGVLAERGLLLHETQAETGAERALRQQRDRLAVLARLPGPASATEPDGEAPLDADTCPACGHELDDPDPTAAALQASLTELRTQVGALTGARPAHRQALADLDTRAEGLRAELRVAEDALADLERANRVGDQTNSDARDFTRGRIDATLARANLADDTQLAVLREQLARAQAAVAALKEELDEDNDREQLTSRLVAVGRDMSRFAERLNLEHSGDSVRLDLARLTVVTDTPTGPAPLFRIGSAANWIGYHLATHLALHRFLTLQGRPVPRFLMLDQPTQAHYPAEADNASGLPDDDADRVAVRAMFELMRDVVAELAPAFQVIVCDHADLPEAWFQAAVRHRWRGGVKLIPADWLYEH
ncbi:DUF3732 domain-containing protein [Nocardioides koreensis]|uniref:DUF3732 domain-containing protein n=1 Tax=Nocardioides koreensis TaxID=433651 RepID=A0ABP5KT73_9ACTN